MNSRFPRTFAILAGFLLFSAPCAVVSLGAEGFGAFFLERFSWSVGGTVLYFPEDNGKQGSDHITIFPSLGAAAAFHIWGPVSIELTEDTYFSNYEYSFKLARPMACDAPQRSAFVFGFITGLQARADFPLKKDINVRAYGGPSADFRVITLAADLHPDDFTRPPDEDPQRQTDAIRDYYWGRGRWFLPVLGAGMDFPINEKFLLGFDIRAWFPTYRLWTEEDSPPIEGWRFGIGLRITPRKARSAASAVPEAAAPEDAPPPPNMVVP
jgi:hypothetical protein